MSLLKNELLMFGVRNGLNIERVSEVVGLPVDIQHKLRFGATLEETEERKIRDAMKEYERCGSIKYER